MASALSNLSNIMIPLIVFYIVGYGIASGVRVYETFVEGAKEGLKTVVSIMPTMVGLMIAVGVLRSSGLLEFIAGLLRTPLSYLKVRSELVPLFCVKMFSSSAAAGLLLDTYKKYGTDSYLGMAASLMMSSTETIFYTMSVYFLAAKVTKTGYTLKGALLATTAGTVASLILACYV